MDRAGKIVLAVAVQALIAWIASVVYEKGVTIDGLRNQVVRAFYPPQLCGLLDASEFVIASRSVVLEDGVAPAAGTRRVVQCSCVVKSHFRDSGPLYLDMRCGEGWSKLLIPAG